MKSSLSFSGKNSEVADWKVKIKSKLIAKGYKTQLLDVNRPIALVADASGPDLKTQWYANADKAVGIIFIHMEPRIMTQFQHFITL